MKVQNFYENLSTLHVGTMDNRCWYVPKQDGRESQILLSGDDWKFAWYPSVEEVPEHFWEKDLEKEGFINMEVPSCWQMKGFDRSSTPISAIPSLMTRRMHPVKISAALM